MSTSFRAIYSTRPQYSREFSRCRIQGGDSIANCNSSNVNSSSRSNTEQVLTQLHLDAIQSELATIRSLYSQRCQELDEITIQNQLQDEQGSGFYLDVEQDEISHEILAIIHQICQLELERLKAEIKLNSFGFDVE